MPLVRTRRLALALCTLAALVALPSATAPAAREGVKWRVTTSMSMQGMSLPGQSVEVCQPVGGDTRVMGPDDSNCSVTEHRRVGNTETFRMRCTGENAMEGRMEITHLGPDHYKGRMQATSSEGSFEMSYEGRKLGGSCDPGALERRMNAAAAQGQAEMARACRDAAAQGEPYMFVGPSTFCTNAADKATLCRNIQTHKHFSRLLETRRAAASAPAGVATDNSDAVAAYCGFRIPAVQDKLCASAEGAGEMAFLAGNCPTLADPIGKRECVGRGYTTPPAPRYVEFCAAWGRANGADGDAPAADAPPAQQTPAENAGDAIREGANKLRGLLGF